MKQGSAKKEAGYSWNRNAAHHRIALTRFAGLAYMMAQAFSIATYIIMRGGADGSREYTTAVVTLAIIAFILTFTVAFTIMAYFYKWVLESDRLTPPAPQQDVRREIFYQNDDGSFTLNPREGRGVNVNRG